VPLRLVRWQNWSSSSQRTRRAAAQTARRAPSASRCHWHCAASLARAGPQPQNARLLSPRSLCAEGCSSFLLLCQVSSGEAEDERKNQSECAVTCARGFDGVHKHIFVARVLIWCKVGHGCERGTPPHAHVQPRVTCLLTGILPIPSDRRRGAIRCGQTGESPARNRRGISQTTSSQGEELCASLQTDLSQDNGLSQTESATPGECTMYMR
jgi:hypothetical protein